jgi:molybdopterin-binding protein
MASGERLGVGNNAKVIVKASDVMIGTAGGN